MYVCMYVCTLAGKPFMSCGYRCLNLCRMHFIAQGYNEMACSNHSMSSLSILRLVSISEGYQEEIFARGEKAREP